MKAAGRTGSLLVLPEHLSRIGILSYSTAKASKDGKTQITTACFLAESEGLNLLHLAHPTKAPLSSDAD